MKEKENCYRNTGRENPKGRGRDLTLIGRADRHVGDLSPALPKWEGGWSVEGGDGFQRQSFGS